jgi:hypothetical protein
VVECLLSKHEALSSTLVQLENQKAGFDGCQILHCMGIIIYLAICFLGRLDCFNSIGLASAQFSQLLRLSPADKRLPLVAGRAMAQLVGDGSVGDCKNVSFHT